MTSSKSIRAKRPCLVCGTPTDGTRCERHFVSKSRGRIHQVVRAQVLAEEATCWICGDPAREGDPLTLDHVVPHSWGGPTTRENGRAAHASCNYSRGAKMESQPVPEELRPVVEGMLAERERERELARERRRLDKEARAAAKRQATSTARRDALAKEFTCKLAVQLYREGLAGRAVAARLGLTEAQVYHLLYKSGVKLRPQPGGARPASFNHERRGAIARLRVAGLGYKAIARQLGMDAGNVKHYVKRMQREGILA